MLFTHCVCYSKNLPRGWEHLTEIQSMINNHIIISFQAHWEINFVLCLLTCVGWAGAECSPRHEASWRKCWKWENRPSSSLSPTDSTLSTPGLTSTTSAGFSILTYSGTNLSWKVKTKCVWFLVEVSRFYLVERFIFYERGK